MMSTLGLKKTWPGPRKKPKLGLYVLRASVRDSARAWRLTGIGVGDVHPALALIKLGSEMDEMLLPHWMETRRGLGRLNSQIFNRSSAGRLANEC